jgi:hypothetical protein
MFDRILNPILVFVLLAGGTFAIGSELFSSGTAVAIGTDVAAVQLPLVEVTGHRLATPVALADTDAVRAARAQLQ